MSKGKTSVAIIGEVTKHPEHKHLIITPYLDEVERICKGTGAFQPIGYKRESIKGLISDGRNICCVSESAGHTARCGGTHYGEMKKAAVYCAQLLFSSNQE